MKSPTLELQDDQKFALMKLKRNIREILKADHDDYFLTRWLQARKWNVDAAEQMYRESMKWRESLGIDEIATWNPPHNFDNYYTFGFMGFTKQQHPVIIIPLAGLDIMGFIKTLTRDEIIKVAVKIIEHHISVAHEYSKDHGYDARQFVLLIDMDKFCIRQYLTKQILEIAIMLAKLYEANYPCILHKVFIINAPAIFTVAFNILKKFLSPDTIGSVKIMNSDRKKWEKAILEVIDANLLPKCFGGSLIDAETGDERCSQKICYGGKIPTEWYINSKQMANVEIMETDMDKIESEMKAVILSSEA